MNEHSVFKEGRNLLVFGPGYIAEISYLPQLLGGSWHVDIRDAANGIFQGFAVFPDEQTVYTHTEEY